MGDVSQAQSWVCDQLMAAWGWMVQDGFSRDGSAIFHKVSYLKLLRPRLGIDTLSLQL